MQIKNIIFIVLALIFLSGCTRVTVEPAQIGKVLSPTGYSPEVLVPGMYTLGMRETLVILDTSTNTYTEKMDVILKDKLTLRFDVRFRGRILNKANVIDAMFNDITHGGDYKVTFTEVYKIYGKAAVRNKSREIMSQYTVEDVHANYGRISKEISMALAQGLQGTPIELSDIALGGVRYPDIVTAAVSEAKERNMQIERETAQAKIDLLKKTNELALINADYAIEMKKANTIADANKVMGKSITPALLDLKRIEVTKIIASNANKGQVVYMPVEGMSSTGANVRMWSK